MEAGLTTVKSGADMGSEPFLERSPGATDIATSIYPARNSVYSKHSLGCANLLRLSQYLGNVRIKMAGSRTD
jgi:hypothetical protein